MMETHMEECTNLDEIRTMCRFCLKQQPDMRELLPVELQASQIPELFKTVTGLELTISTEYSKFVCAKCETQMQNAQTIRDTFRRIDQFWKTLLLLSKHGFRCETEFKVNEVVSEMDQNDEASTDLVEIEVESTVEQDVMPSEDVPEILGGDDTHGFVTEEEEKSLTKLKEPVRTKSETDTIFVCDICGNESKTKRLLLRHMTAKHHKVVKNSTCHICGKSNLKRLAQHLRDHRKADIFKCAHCPKGFNRRTLLRQHERLHTGERPFICEVCAFSFTSSAALKRHCKSHTMGNDPTDGPPKHQAQRLRVNPTQPIPKLPPRQGIRLECPLCHNTYVNRASLQPHMKLMHGADGLAAWKHMLDTTCLVCNEKFACAEDLAKHKPQHIDHQCEICRRRFHSKITLDLHVKIHSNKERKHQCEICEASYLCAFTLKNHIRRAHTAERPFQCAVCQNGFVERWELNTHMRKMHSSHKTLKPHTCPLCPESFKSKVALRSHTEKHTGQYRYWCEPCNRNLHSGPLLAEHERSYHPERRNELG